MSKISEHLESFDGGSSFLGRNRKTTEPKRKRKKIFDMDTEDTMASIQGFVTPDGFSVNIYNYDNNVDVTLSKRDIDDLMNYLKKAKNLL